MSGLLVYVIIWWLVIFMVLPWGNRPIEAADVAKGHAAGSPVKPRMWVKAGITTVIATVLFAIFYWAQSRGLVSIRL